MGIDPKVTALVYVAARAPDADEDFVALSGKFPTMPVRAGVQERDGFTVLSEEAFINYFANGVARDKAEVLYAEQEPTAAALIGGRQAALPYDEDHAERQRQSLGRRSRRSRHASAVRIARWPDCADRVSDAVSRNAAPVRFI